MEFSRQEYRSGLPFSTPGDLLDPGTKPTCPALAGGSFTASTTWEALWSQDVMRHYNQDASVVERKTEPEDNRAKTERLNQRLQIRPSQEPNQPSPSRQQGSVLTLSSLPSNGWRQMKRNSRGNANVYAFVQCCCKVLQEVRGRGVPLYPSRGGGCIDRSGEETFRRSLQG